MTFPRRSARQRGEAYDVELGGPSLRVQGVSKAFGGLQALSDVTFEAGPGEVSALIGPNGAGKTTLLDIVSGFTVPDQGTVSVGGHEMSRRGPHIVARSHVRRSFQNIRLFPELTASENVWAGLYWESRLRTRSQSRRSRAKQEEAIWSALSAVGLGDVSNVPVRHLPYGAQKRIEVARVLVVEPSVILLDEPFAGVGQEEADHLLAAIQKMRQRSAAVVLVEHIMEVVMEVSDRVIVLDAGRVIANDAPAVVSADPTVRAAYLGDA